MAVAMIGPKFYAWDRNGKPLAFGKLHTYQARTNIPKPTYQSEDQVVENTNPVILNGEGYADIYLDGSYKMVLKDSEDNEIWSSDPVSSATASEWINCVTASYASPVSFKINGNQTDTYEVGRRVRLDSNNINYDYSTIVSSVYSSEETTVTVSDSVVKTGLEFSCVSIVGVESLPAIETDTVADMVKIPFEDGSLVKTKGYYVAGDGGQAEYLVSATELGEELRDHTLVNGNVAILQVPGAFNVKQVGAVGDGVADDTPSLQKCLDLAITESRAVYISPGIYKTTSQLTITENPAPGNAYGVTVYGDNSNWASVSTIYAEHNDPAIFSLKGSNGSRLSGLKLISDDTTYPKCAIVLGRDSNVDSCGWHNITDVWIDGMYSVAPIYSIASEENFWSDIFVQLRGGGAKYGFYTGISDALNVDSLPASSNLANSIRKMNIWNWVNDPNSACIYIEGAQAVGSWSFTDCYCIPKSGSYYEISNRQIDGLDCLGPISFNGCSGEIYAPVAPYEDTPMSAFKLSSPGANSNLIGLTIVNSRCQLINALGTRKLLDVDANLSLITPNIVMQPAEDPTIGYSVFRAKVKNGIFEVADSSAWTPLDFSGVWADNFGVPYAGAAFQVDSTGTLRLRGDVNNGSTGVGKIAQLPPGHEPQYRMFFMTQDGTANAKILIDTDGSINLNVGTGAQVNLNNVAFKLSYE